MDYTIDRNTLLPALYTAQHIATTKSPAPILSHVSLTVDDRTLNVRATDLEIGFSQLCRGSENNENGLCDFGSANAKRLYDIVKNLPEGPIELNAVPGHLHLLANKSKVSIAILTSEEFPNIGEWGKAQDSQRVDCVAWRLRNALDKALMASSESMIGFSNPKSILFEAKKTELLCCVGTDGTRMSHVAGLSDPVEDDVSFTISLRGARELRRFLTDPDDLLTLTVTPSVVTVDSNNGRRLLVRLTEGEFPPYRQFENIQYSGCVPIPCQILKEALGRVLPFTFKRQYGVDVRLENDTMTLSSHMPGIGNATETIAVDCITAAPTSITYSAYFPADVLNDPLLLMNQNGTARFQFTTELGPAKLSAAEDESFTYIMQPVKKII